MKKTIFLDIEYLDLKSKKLKEAEILDARKLLFKKAVAEFKKGMKIFLDDKSLSIIRQDFPLPEIVIEYDKNAEEIYSKLLELDVVQIIDDSVYNYTTEEKLPQDNYANELRKKMSKFLK